MSRPERTLFNGPVGDDHDRIDRMVRRARANASEIRDSEIRFVDDMFVRLDRYGADTFLSEKQRNWLEAIDARLDEAGVPEDPDDDGDAVARPTDEGWE